MTFQLSVHSPVTNYVALLNTSTRNLTESERVTDRQPTRVDPRLHVYHLKVIAANNHPLEGVKETVTLIGSKGFSNFLKKRFR